MNSKRKIEINIVEVQTYKILIQINSNYLFVFIRKYCYYPKFNKFPKTGIENSFSTKV